ncbi:MAG TPA: YdeI/OmpD-associated family protein [Bryobacteraceae bacterium]|nr:YdeI/OmpD-associated family protein [Bryobacteraceae bacterium]
MATEVPLLDIRSRPQWRNWLDNNHASSAGVWLVYYKDHTGVASIDYEDSVREALCFGWVDSLIKRLDENRYARKFTPRRPASKWSDSNRKRWRELNAAGLLAEAGIAAAPTRNHYAPRPQIPELPAYAAEALRANAKAWKFFQGLAPTDRRHFVAWIHLAKRPDTRERRIRESIVLLAAGKKLGLK